MLSSSGSAGAAGGAFSVMWQVRRWDRSDLFGAPFGGWKQSGLGREECLGELLAFTQEKNVHVSLKQGRA
jgi:acyl-CoA reductase-like NAD-dependent aldehyde dehydrogenase